MRKAFAQIEFAQVDPPAKESATTGATVAVDKSVQPAKRAIDIDQWWDEDAEMAAVAQAAASSVRLQRRRQQHQ